MNSDLRVSEVISVLTPRSRGVFLVPLLVSAIGHVGGFWMGRGLTVILSTSLSLGTSATFEVESVRIC